MLLLFLKKFLRCVAVTRLRTFALRGIFSMLVRTIAIPSQNEIWLVNGRVTLSFRSLQVYIWVYEFAFHRLGAKLIGEK